MNKTLQQFVNSFKLGKDFSYTFLVDAITLSLLYLAVNFWLSWWSSELQSMLVLFQSFGSGQIPSTIPGQWSVLFLVFGTPLLLILSGLFLYSFSQALIWNYLDRKKLTHKTYRRWNALNLALVFPLLGFVLIFVLVKILVSLLLNLILVLIPVFYVTHAALLDNIRVAVNNAVSFYLILLFLSLVFFISYSFVKKYRVWASLAAGFTLFGKKWKQLLLMLVLATLAASLLSLVMLPINQRLLYSPPLVSALVNLIVAVLFLAWLRLYIVKTVAHESN